MAARSTRGRKRHVQQELFRRGGKQHGEDRAGRPSTWLIDPFSSGNLFPDWQELADKDLMWPIRDTYDPLVVYRPRCWLLREGWKAAGPISARDVPSRRR